MSIQAMLRAMEESEARAVERLVLLVMANRAGGDNDECFASVGRLAFEARVDPRTVQRCIARLVSTGDLAPNGIHAKYRTNVYFVMPQEGVAESHPPGIGGVPAPPELDLGSRGLGSEVGLTSVGREVSAPRPVRPTSYPPAFDEFWDLCPVKRDKAKALAAWKKAVRRADPHDINSGMRRYVAWLDAHPDTPAKYPEGWLNGDRWLDEDEPSTTDRAAAMLRARRGTA